MQDKKYLYHYKPLLTLDHFLQLKNYMDQKVWFTRLDEFNDPFEGQFNFKMAGQKEILDNTPTFEKYFCECKKFFPSLTKEEFRIDLQKPEAFEMLGGIKSDPDFFKAHGAICLTANPYNIPMWAHYAKNHQGYCVIFEIDLNFIYKKLKQDYEKENAREYSENEFYQLINKVFTPFDSQSQEILSFQQPQDDDKKQFILSKVIYQKIKPEIQEVEIDQISNDPDRQYNFNKYILKKSFGVKFSQWSYEDEYRLIVNANSKECGLMDLRGYPFIKITGIIMGCAVGQNLNDDAINFLETYELSEPANLCRVSFKSTDLSGKTKEFISHLSKKYNIELYLVECSSEKYEITCSKYMCP